jgi:hypothetical protein
MQWAIDQLCTMPISQMAKIHTIRSNIGPIIQIKKCKFSDLKYITEAEDIKNHMDLLSMFYTFFNRKNAYYKDYFAKNMMDNVYTIVMDAMDQIDSAYELVKKPNNRVRDPGTSRRIRDAVVNDIGGGSKQRSHSGGRRRSGYDSRYSYTYSRQKSGDRRRSGGSGAGTGQSSRYLTNG